MKTYLEAIQGFTANKGKYQSLLVRHQFANLKPIINNKFLFRTSQALWRFLTLDSGIDLSGLVPAPSAGTVS